jgi:hypothetical protein
MLAIPATLVDAGYPGNSGDVVASSNHQKGERASQRSMRSNFRPEPKQRDQLLVALFATKNTLKMIMTLWPRGTAGAAAAYSSMEGLTHREDE